MGSCIFCLLDLLLPIGPTLVLNSHIRGTCSPGCSMLALRGEFLEVGVVRVQGMGDNSKFSDVNGMDRILGPGFIEYISCCL